MGTPFDLYIISDGGARLVERVRQALSGCPAGRAAVQLRMKRAPTDQIMRMGELLRRVTADAGAHLLINGRVDVAMALDAEGVHLPSRGLSPGEARNSLGSTKLIGMSCHDEAELRQAALGGANFATLSPFHRVRGKGAPLGPDRFGQLAATAGLPVLALGGIRPADVASALSAGACGVAVIRSVLGAADPGLAARELMTCLDQARGHTLAAQ